MHKPIMKDYIADLFAKGPHPLHFLDATFGRGGHSKALLDSIPLCTVSAVDRDPDAVSYAQKEMAPYKERFSIVHAPFSETKNIFQGKLFSGVLMDVGLSSPQIDQGERGFSIQKDGPLDMRMDPTQGPSAADIVNALGEKDLANLIFKYGEERNSRYIAKRIADERKKSPITTTHRLGDIIQKTSRRYSRIHPATRTFQALRIAVNQELDELEKTLGFIDSLVLPGGILCTLCFHSLEDRIVKRFFKQSECFFCTEKKPLRPDENEIKENNRSRSARLRFGIRKL